MNITYLKNGSVESVIKLWKEKYVFALNMRTALMQQETSILHAHRYVA